MRRSRTGTSSVAPNVSSARSAKPSRLERSKDGTSTLFEGHYAQWWDVTPDDERFLMLTVPQADLRDLQVVVNWAEELKRLVPTNN